MNKNFFIFLTLLTMLGAFLLPAFATTYYVSPQGNDGNDGSLESPWESIQKGAEVAIGGDTIMVADGNYDEHVLLNTSGSSENAPVTFVSQNQYGAKCKGFTVQGDYITIDGFSIEADAANEYGIYASNRNYINIVNCHIFECPGGGINITGGSTHCTLSGNILEHNGQWGIHAVGSSMVIENNEILKTVQHHPKIEFTGFHGEDADGLRVFGSNYTIRGNYFHDLGNLEDTGNHQSSPEYPDDYPHVDCIQSWDRTAHGGRPVLQQSIIENNRCSLSRASGKGIMISAIDSGCSNLIIINNIFEYRDIGIAMDSGTFSNIFIYNNLFKANLHDASWGAALYLKDITNYAVENNIMVDGHAEARKIIGGTGVVDYNLVWYSDGSTPAGTPGPNGNELWGVDPQFFSYSGENGGNYRLKPGSEAIDSGRTISQVGFDKDGNGRPLGTGYDLGPYEYDNNALTHSLHYAAGAHGTIHGTSSQMVLDGMDGTVVAAIPENGYTFSKWSDASTVNPRHDINVINDISVTAMYVRNISPHLFLLLD
jgi:parallel beta-helix repeat protein